MFTVDANNTAPNRQTIQRTDGRTSPVMVVVAMSASVHTYQKNNCFDQSRGVFASRMQRVSVRLTGTIEKMKTTLTQTQMSSSTCHRLAINRQCRQSAAGNTAATVSRCRCVFRALGCALNSIIQQSHSAAGLSCAVRLSMSLATVAILYRTSVGIRTPDELRYRTTTTHPVKCVG